MSNVQNNIDWSWAYPYLDKICGDFYNPKKLLSYHKPYNIVQSGRSSGKTTVFACLMLLNYVIKRKRFWYMRRTDDETVLGARSFFDDALEILKFHYPELFGKFIEVYYEGGVFYIKYLDGDIEIKEPIGKTMPLSMVYKRKSVKMQDANCIIFDEFVAVSSKEYLGTQDNINEEGERLNNWYTTCDRKIGHSWCNETTVFCLGNSTTLYCPLFIYLDAVQYIKSDSKFIAPKRKDYVIERFDRVKATEGIEQSFGYRLASNSEKNKMYNNDTEEFTGTYISSEKPKKSECFCNFIFAGKTMGLWWSEYKQLYWIGSPDNSKDTYALDIEGHEMSDKELCFAINDFRFSDSIKRAYMRGRLFFSNYDIMRTILAYLKLQ